MIDMIGYYMSEIDEYDELIEEAYKRKDNEAIKNYEYERNRLVIKYNTALAKISSRKA